MDVDKLTDMCRAADPREATTTDIWIGIWDVAGRNGWLKPWLGMFMHPEIPPAKVVECAVCVKSIIPETPYREIVKNILYFVKN